MKLTYQRPVSLKEGSGLGAVYKLIEKYMAGFRESVASETLSYKVEPQILAEVCQDVLKKIGKVKQVSRETGMISGEIKLGRILGLATNPATLTLRISKKEDTVELSIKVSRTEGIIARNGAQRAMMKFVSAIGDDARLKGKSGAMW